MSRDLEGVRFMYIFRKAFGFCLAVVLLVGIAWPGSVKAPSCLRPYVSDIVENTNLTTTQKNKLFRVVSGFDKSGKDGMVALLGLNDRALDASIGFKNILFMETEDARHLYADSNSFFSAVNDIVDKNGSVITGPDGLEGALKTTASGSNAAAAMSSAVGSEFDIFVAQKAGKGNVIAMQSEIDTVLGTRRYDLVTKCETCGLGQLYNEDKNWGSALAGASDSRLRDFLDQFDRDILIQGPTNFDSFRLNLRTIVQAQDDTILQAILKKFDGATIIDQIGADRAAQLKQIFTDKWTTIRVYY